MSKKYKNALSKPLHSLLIVDNNTDSLFLVENKSKKSTVTKILENRRLAEEIERKSQEVAQPSTSQALETVIKQELDIEEPKVLESANDIFIIQGSAEHKEIKQEPLDLDDSVVKESNEDTYNPYADLNDDFEWQEDEGYDWQKEDYKEEDVSDDNAEVKTKPASTSKPTSKPSKSTPAKRRKPYSSILDKKDKLTGKTACKYCKTLFKTKQDRGKHDCEYLKCDPANFICRICNKELSKKTHSNHMGAVHAEANLNCDICGMKFKQRRKLELHLSTHTGNRPFKCEIESCKMSFISSFGLSRHMVTHGIAAPTHKCKWCTKEFATNYSLQHHITKAHSKTFQYWCDLDGMGFVKKDLLLNHMLTTHVKERKFICEECGKTFPIKRYLQKHMARHEVDARTLECPICGKKLAEKRNLDNHMKLHTGERNHICPKCGECFITKAYAKRHFCDVGPAKKRRKPNYNKINLIERYCRYCNSDFENRTQCETHDCPYLNCSDRKYFICKYCGEEIYKTWFKHHMTVHAEETYKCNFCLKQFNSKAYLEQHVALHTGEKPHKCGEINCNASFSSKHALLQHGRNHGIEPPVYHCEFCSKRFYSLKRLSEHNAHHSGELKHKCEICFQSFPRKESYNDHKITAHSTEKNFECDICHKAFALKKYLYNHRRLHEIAQTKSYLCKCGKTYEQRSLYNKCLKSHAKATEEVIFEVDTKNTST